MEEKAFRFRLNYKGKVEEFIYKVIPDLDSLNVYRINSTDRSVLNYASKIYDDGNIDVINLIRNLIFDTHKYSSIKLKEEMFNLPMRSSVFSLDEFKNLIKNSKDEREAFFYYQLEFNRVVLSAGLDAVKERGFPLQHFKDYLEEVEAFYLLLKGITKEDIYDIISNNKSKFFLFYIKNTLLRASDYNTVNIIKDAVLSYAEEKYSFPAVIPLIYKDKQMMKYFKVAFDEYKTNGSKLVSPYYLLWKVVYSHYVKDEEKRLKIDRFIREYNEKVKNSGKEYFIEDFQDPSVTPEGFVIPFLYRIPDRFITLNGVKYAVVSDSFLANSVEKVFLEIDDRTKRVVAVDYPMEPEKELIDYPMEIDEEL